MRWRSVVGMTSRKRPHIKIGGPPPYWQTVYDNILEMRKDRTAPVDSMGCERAHDLKAEPKVQRFQCLVSLMLSSMTKDEVNFAAMTRLREHGLTVDSILEMSEETLGQLIYPVGFWKVRSLRKKTSFFKGGLMFETQKFYGFFHRRFAGSVGSFLTLGCRRSKCKMLEEKKTSFFKQKNAVFPRNEKRL